MRSLELAKQGKVESVVLFGEGKAFSAGADISEFKNKEFTKGSSLREVLHCIDTFEVPVVSYINGIALGGGLETALSSHWRYASPNATVGLPEVHLGLLPGAGGTQRLPRLCGVASAVEIMTSGRVLKAPEALKLGIVDTVGKQHLSSVDDIMTEMHAYIHSQVLQHSPASRRIALRSIPPVDPGTFPNIYKSLQKSARGLQAPVNIVKAVEAAVSLGSGEAAFQQGLLREVELFGELAAGSQSRALQYFFFAERKVGQAPAAANIPEVKTVGVIGGGTMGTGIAMSFLNAKIPVTLVEVNETLLKQVHERIVNTYKSSSAYKSGKLTDTAIEATLKPLTLSTELSSLRDRDLVIEAVFENLAIKQQIFRELDGLCKPTALLASNTSCLDLDAIASATTRPQSVIGTRKYISVCLCVYVDLIVYISGVVYTYTLYVYTIHSDRLLLSCECDEAAGDRAGQTHRGQRHRRLHARGQDHREGVRGRWELLWVHREQVSGMMGWECKD